VLGFRGGRQALFSAFLNGEEILECKDYSFLRTLLSEVILCQKLLYLKTFLIKVMVQQFQKKFLSSGKAYDFSNFG
jgi:hypothetical protein